MYDRFALNARQMYEECKKMYDNVRTLSMYQKCTRNVRQMYENVRQICNKCTEMYERCTTNVRKMYETCTKQVRQMYEKKRRFGQRIVRVVNAKKLRQPES